MHELSSNTNNTTIQTQHNPKDRMGAPHAKQTRSIRCCARAARPTQKETHSITHTKTKTKKGASQERREALSRQMTTARPPPPTSHYESPHPLRLPVVYPRPILAPLVPAPKQFHTIGLHHHRTPMSPSYNTSESQPLKVMCRCNQGYNPRRRVSVGWVGLDGVSLSSSNGGVSDERNAHRPPLDTAGTYGCAVGSVLPASFLTPRTVPSEEDAIDSH